MANDKNTAQDLFDWLGFRRYPNWVRARKLGGLIGFLLLLSVTILFVFAIGAAIRLLFHAMASGGAGASLGTGALIAALLGAPFVIWGTWLRHKTQRIEQEGHMTDRITKAVEQLGAEKTFERIGRPVKVWTGNPSQTTIFTAGNAPPKIGERAIVLDYKRATSCYEDKNDEMHEVEGLEYSIRKWPKETTRIQWQGATAPLNESEHLASEGDWQVFSETVANLEVRIGAILSLERIAQDSMIIDRGRDHIRVMEILCAYIRGNAAAASLDNDESSPPFKIRTDIQIAIDAIKRRDSEQQKLEEQQKYRLDLRGVDFRGANLSKGVFRGAIMVDCRFEYSFMQETDFSGAHFHRSILNYIHCIRTKFIGANMNSCRIDQPEPTPGGFIESINMAETCGLSLVGAKVTSIEYFDEQKNSTFGTKDTILNADLDQDRNKCMELKKRIRYLKAQEQIELASQLEKYLQHSPFKAWVALDSSDLAIPHFLQEFRHEHGLTGWPYDDT